MTRIRSFKCVICDEVKKDVKKRLDVMVLLYEKREEEILMCRKCNQEALKYYHMQKGKR